MLAPVALIVFLCANTYSARLLPKIKAHVINKAREYAVSVINTVVEREITSGYLIYSELVTFVKTENGAVTAIITDTARVSACETRVTALAEQCLKNAPRKALSIPLGEVTNIALFSRLRLPVHRKTVTNVTAQIKSELEPSGAFITRHKLALIITAEIILQVPGGSATAEVTSLIPIAEAVIFGNAPKGG